MPIREFDNGDVFTRETIKIMSKAFVAACKDLGLKPGADQTCRLLASRIVASARTGERDPARLKAAALVGTLRP